MSTLILEFFQTYPCYTVVKSATNSTDCSWYDECFEFSNIFNLGDGNHGCFRHSRPSVAALRAFHCYQAQRASRLLPTCNKECQIGSWSCWIIFAGFRWIVENLGAETSQCRERFGDWTLTMAFPDSMLPHTIQTVLYYERWFKGTGWLYCIDLFGGIV